MLVASRGSINLVVPRQWEERNRIGSKPDISTGKNTRAAKTLLRIVSKLRASFAARKNLRRDAGSFDKRRKDLGQDPTMGSQVGLSVDVHAPRSRLVIRRLERTHQLSTAMLFDHKIVVLHWPAISEKQSLRGNAGLP